MFLSFFYTFRSTFDDNVDWSVNEDLTMNINFQDKGMMLEKKLDY